MSDSLNTQEFVNWVKNIHQMDDKLSQILPVMEGLQHVIAALWWIGMIMTSILYFSTFILWFKTFNVAKSFSKVTLGLKLWLIIPSILYGLFLVLWFVVPGYSV
jgi:hypothetical protein